MGVSRPARGGLGRFGGGVGLEEAGRGRGRDRQAGGRRAPRAARGPRRHSAALHCRRKYGVGSQLYWATGRKRGTEMAVTVREGGEVGRRRKALSSLSSEFGNFAAQRQTEKAL